MEYTIESQGYELVVAIAGRLDAQTSPALEEDMAAALGGVVSVEFDLAELEYISSAGLRVLLATYKLMAKRDGEMRVLNANGEVLDTFSLSGFGEIFGIS